MKVDSVSHVDEVQGAGAVPLLGGFAPKPPVPHNSGNRYSYSDRAALLPRVEARRSGSIRLNWQLHCGVDILPTQSDHYN